MFLDLTRLDFWVVVVAVVGAWEVVVVAVVGAWEVVVVAAVVVGLWVVEEMRQ